MTKYEVLLENILEDREQAKDLVVTVKREMLRAKDYNIGNVLAKFLEALQRSNEQYMKALSMERKTKDKEFMETGPLSEEELEEVYNYSNNK